MSTAVLLMR